MGLFAAISNFLNTSIHKNLGKPVREVIFSYSYTLYLLPCRSYAVIASKGEVQVIEEKKSSVIP